MELVIEKRDIIIKPKVLRKKGILPAILYGRSEASTPISVVRKDFEKLFRKVGESTVISLTGLGEAKDVLIQDVAIHALTGDAMHADFYVIERGQTVTVSVPLEFIGVSPAVKDLGCVLVKVMHEIEMEVLPKDLPNAIIVDLSLLKNIDDKLTVGDLVVPPSAQLSDDKEELVAIVSIQEEEKEEVAIDLSAIEVTKKGKKEEAIVSEA